MAQSREHLSREHGQQEKHQDRDFKIVRVRRSHPREIIKTPYEHDGAADQSSNFEIRQAAMIEHAVKFPKGDQAERADQRVKCKFVAREGNN